MKKLYLIIALAFLGLTVGFLYLPTLRWLGIQWFVPGIRFYAHGPLVLLISIFLVLRKRQLFAHAETSLRGSLVALLGLGLGIIAVLWNLAPLYAYALSAFSLVVLILALLLVVCGKEVTRQLLFPVLFLTMAIPLPFTAAIADFLANIVAASSMALAQAAGVTAVRQGVLITVGTQEYLIAAVCSGLNLVLALYTLMLPLLYLKGYSWIKKVALLSAVPVVALVFKSLLVATVFWLTQNGGQELAMKAYHGWAGMLTFWLSLIVMLAPFFFLARRKSSQAMSGATG
ncbi:MAG: exosortase/archaeosortase family protein [Chloroflexi bacterium]|nr:exosortase/archaeosortase family protein [Chloroflexota bacterium]